MSTSHHDADASANPAARVETDLNPNWLASRNADLQKGLKPSARLRSLESTISSGIRGISDVGGALVAIRDGSLQVERGYRRGHAGFDDYCREHWGFERRRANQFIAAAETLHALGPGTIVPSTESQVRELARADEPAEVWAEVVDQHEPTEITAAVIREHVEARKDNAVPPPPPAVVIDLTAITSAVRAAVRAGATTQELYDAYQEGFKP